jgi:hypothetical protein
MFHRIHQKLGTAGFIISIVALVAALSGGAYAASNGLTGKQKKEVETIAKKFAGKAGPAGQAGATGAPGAKGDAGAPGSQGAAGAAGAKGEKGEKGAKGEKGEKGDEGSPWTGGGVLPAGKSETGTWSVAVPPTKEAFTFSTGISFPIPLAKAGKAFFITATAVTNEEFGRNGTASCTVGAPGCVDTGCRWKLNDENAKPEAKTEGTLCIFAEQEEFGEVNLKILRAPGEPFAEDKYGPAGIHRCTREPAGL